MSTVAITHNQEYTQAISEALKYCEIESIIRDKFVAVKPNETWASSEDFTAITQADSLRATLEYLLQFQPQRLVVTGGSGAAQTPDVMEISGMMQVIRDLGVEFFDHNQEPFVEVELEYEPEKDFD